MRTFVCEACDGEFPASPPEDVLADAVSVFGLPDPDGPPPQMALVCDNCYQQMMAWAREQGLPLTWSEPGDPR